MFFRPRDGTPGMPEDLGPLSQAQNYIVSHGSPKPTKYPKITAAGIPRQWAELGLEPQPSTAWKASMTGTQRQRCIILTSAGVGGVVR